ncbi:hypothetical protein DYB34_013078, partial [Aphanomyces astaci]
MAGKWFKKELFSAVIDWCSVLLPFFPKCYLLLGLSYQQLAKWDLAVDAMAAGALLQHVPVEKYLQILYKVAPEVGCNSLKACLYLEYLQSLVSKLDMLPMSRQVAALTVEFEVRQGQLAAADAKLTQIRAIPVNEVYQLKQSCVEDILQGDIHTLAKTISLATHSYKKAKAKSVPMYPQFQDILAQVYRKLALTMPDPVLASQKAAKLSLTPVESRLALQTLSHALRLKHSREG